MKRAYQYTFYKLYCFYEAAPSKWMSDWKAAFSLMVLEIWTFLSLLNYWTVFTKKIPGDQFFIVAGVLLVIALTTHKFLVFEYKNRWKDYVRAFSRLSKRKNQLGALLVWLSIGVLLANLILSFYLLSQS